MTSYVHIEGGHEMILYKTYILPYLKQYRWLIGVTLFFGVLTILASAALTFTSGYLITRTSEMPWNILMVYVPIVGVRFFGILRPVSHYLERLTGHNTVLKILAVMRVKLYEVLEPQALFIRSRFQMGDLIGTLADDIEHLQDAYIRTIFPTVIGLFLFFFSVVSLSLFDWLFALWIGICLAIILFLYPLISLFLMKRRQIALKEKRGELYRSYTDTLLGMADWIISGKKKKFIDHFAKTVRVTDQIERKMAYWNHSRMLQMQAITGVILIMVGVWAGFEAVEGNILPTYIASFTLVVLPIMEGIFPVSDAVEKVPSYKESLERIDKITKQAPSNLEKAKITPIDRKPNIVMEKVRFRYPKEKEDALKDITLTFRHGEKIALLGRSGSGKSTMLQLLFGSLRPTEGKLLIGGHKPEDFGEGIHELVSVLNQKPYLFATSVENNIRLGKKDATKEELEEVIQKVRLDQYILSLPDGLKTQMEEAGQRFSGGERHRVALARILLKNTPIVILDEPTVGLDPQTEMGLLETIFETLQDKTIILITHHLAGLEKMDQIIFLDKGEVIMKGTHDELMKNISRYKSLYLMDRGYI